MIQSQNIRLSVPANTSAERQSFVYPDTSDRGFYNLFFPSLIISRVIQNVEMVMVSAENLTVYCPCKTNRYMPARSIKTVIEDRGEANPSEESFS